MLAACCWMSADWLPDYLADSIAGEETGEKARSEVAGMTVEDMADLLSFIEGL